jgi:glycolate oxidase FAD binding subunit
VDVVLATRRLNRILSHSQGDLTVRVEAGASLAEVNAALALHGQWLALDSPFNDTATIGGLLATNDSGPHRHRFGSPRDLVIGIEVATADGRLAKAGGQVVKNVAGYDLSKLVSGSFGELAAVVAATFKLTPIAEMSATLRTSALALDSSVAMVESISTSQLEPVAVEVHVQRRAGQRAAASVLVRFASIASAVGVQVSEASARMAAAGITADVVRGDAERELWKQQITQMWANKGVIVRASWLPAELGRVGGTVETLPPDLDVELTGRAGVGAGLIRIDGETAAQVNAVRWLRDAGVFGQVVIVRADPAVKREAGVWGPIPNALLLASIKRSLDPHGVLGAGRGPF